MFRHFKNQAGQIMALTLMITGVGALSTGAMLGIITTSARSSGSFHDNTESYYAAAAGIEIVIADLLEGKDALDTGDTPYQVPQLDVNGRPVKYPSLLLLEARSPEYCTATSTRVRDKA